MIVFLIVELLLDYVLKIPFRTVRWQAIAYVMLLRVYRGNDRSGRTAGRGWGIAAIVSFLIMAGLAFFQRHITGM